MPEADDRKILQVRVPSNLADRFAAIAGAHNKSVSQLLREVVEEYVAGADTDQLQEALRDRFEIERRRLLEAQQPECPRNSALARAALRFRGRGAAVDHWLSGWLGQGVGFNWALVDRTSDSLMGRVSLKSVDLHDGSAGVAYWMVPAWRGRGFCSQAVIALCQWAFNAAGFHRIGLEHSVANTASCRVATKAGFHEEGIRREAALHADGWHDMHEHALLAHRPLATELV